jgi:hypothetical protein
VNPEGSTIPESPKRLEYLGQGRTDGPELFQIDFGNLLQPALAFLGQFQQNPPTVAFVDNPAQEFKFLHSVDKADGGVMPNEKKAREITDGSQFSAGEPPDTEQGLMLLRRQAGPVGSRLAKSLKFPQFVPKPGEDFVIYRIGYAAII